MSRKSIDSIELKPAAINLDGRDLFLNDSDTMADE